ncbi:MAG: branched-chain amino acid ABC transporter permease [Acidovorax sp.]|jgi:branched-chain amino acid transport system permease protein|uniref:branched-chain amino acid ABC transporter permease n=1 Tax=Acidovorax sp. TaxID=1872122 RepID=UPI000AC7EBF8|nr:branched-chain amino acid ABC transporter permease [Acidovorax sp.]MCO4095220.1 branched-chain amino acid ABC transporter permease [Acidovorax sp.]MDH4425604.1 branched-chain amino acid ABC transporter permease [Acidovorax sp.]MDH4464318.1 branched-chain amino acid ABC transporter permease [Acidovorax sp.]
MNTKTFANIGYGLLVLGLIAAPFLGAYPIFVMKLMCFALFASAFNLLLGYTGLLSFGHAAFLGGAAYVTGHAIKVWGLTPEVGLLLGTAGGALLGLLFGWLAIRRQGIYFSMITLALAQMLFFACLQAPFTGGEDGLQGVPRGKLFGVLDLKSDLVMYYVALVIVVVAFLVIVRTIHSPFGQVLKGIKENEPRAISLGYDTHRFKLLAFVISAALAGLAGSLKTLVLGFATLSDVHWTASGQVILMTLVGGLGTLSGPLIGSAVVVLLENKIGEFGNLLAALTSVEWFKTLGESVTMVTGLIFVICVLAFRRGIMGEIIAWMARRRSAGGNNAH